MKAQKKTQEKKSKINDDDGYNKCLEPSNFYVL